MNLETVIGLEIHIQSKTKSKMFCDCKNLNDKEDPNTHVCQICLAHPGTLPVANKQAIDFGIMMALALNCKINKKSIWSRKNYFYPDLSKGYQISQFDEPLSENGHVTVKTKEGDHRIGITRLHLEEDAAKNFHSKDRTLVDYNRGGAPLMEIVSEPDFRTPEQARVYLQELRLLARYLEVSDADMEKGHMRCDANISMRPEGEDKLYPKTEIKNLNSFRSVERALAYEIKRQTDLWNKSTPVDYSSTRGWDEKLLKTVEQRDKEESADYRYFPEPDLKPLILSEDEINKLKATLPELPQEKRLRFINEYGLKYIDAKLLVEDKGVAKYFEQVMSETRSWLESLDGMEGSSEEIWEQSKVKLVKSVFGWITSELFKLFKENNTSISDIKITPENFAEFITLVFSRKVNSTSAQVLFKEMFDTGGDPSNILDEKDLSQVGDTKKLNKIIEKIVKNNPDQVKEYKSGKEPLIKFFIGQAMKETKGKADPQVLEDLFKNKLK
ncbi:Asp-tRNA(Asn)/Glu-tRNA(Gln) amidotransferase subunit GatB [bacterium]|nr:Asp-tRNA(Asn)/Glu-tRNA(Gln) amidotransferase subunit GatB [bacterium]